MHRLFGSPLLTALAILCTLTIAGSLIYLSAQPPEDSIAPLSQPSDHRTPYATQPPQARSDGPIWTAIIFLSILIAYLVLIKLPRDNRKALTEIQKLRDESAVGRQRMRAAGELRDALAVFNRQAFYGPPGVDGLVPLYRAMAASRLTLQKRNSRFMSDPIGASHIQSAQQMLNELDEDLSRDWPQLYGALNAVPDNPGEDELQSLRQQRSYAEALTYIRTLQVEIRSELEHAELRLRRLLRSPADLA